MHHNINRGQQKAALLLTNSMNTFSFTRVHALFCHYYIFFVRFFLEETRVGGNYGSFSSLLLMGGFVFPPFRWSK